MPQRKYPTIVVAHPNGGVKEQVAGLYAQRLAEQGYIAITADAAYQGASGGQPRSVDMPSHRIEDIHGMADFISRFPWVDTSRAWVCWASVAAAAIRWRPRRPTSGSWPLATDQHVQLRPGAPQRPMPTRSWTRSSSACSRLPIRASTEKPPAAKCCTPADANLTDAQIATLPFDLYRQGYAYYWKTHAHPKLHLPLCDQQPGGPDALGRHRPDRAHQPSRYLMIAGSKVETASTRPRTLSPRRPVPPTIQLVLFLLDGATHIETYWVPKYVDAQCAN